MSTLAVGACLTRPAAASAPLRYIKYEGAVRKYVIVEIDDGGDEVYFEQECGEPRWYSFEPSQAERCAVDSLRAAGKGRDGWSAYIDIDAQGVESLLPLSINVDLFRSFVRSRYGQLFGVDLDRKLLAFVRDGNAAS
jgi:hypothetical protein